MTYRVSRSASNYELQNSDPNGGSTAVSSNVVGSEPYLHYIHSGPQSASVANIQHLTTLRQQQHQQQQYYDENQTELHRYAQNADRFSTAVSKDFLIFGADIDSRAKRDIQSSNGEWKIELKSVRILTIFAIFVAK